MQKLFFILLVFYTVLGYAQEGEVNWISFEELEPKLAEQPKKVLIYFYADWCVYCKKMEQAVYAKAKIKSLLEDKYHAVKFNVESQDTIYFGGRTFVNAQLGKQRNPYHEIPEYLAGRSNKELGLPATIVLDKNFNILNRYYRYIPPKEMVDILNKY